MTAAALLADLRRRGVHLEPDGGGLFYRAPKGILTAADRDALRQHRDKLLALLLDEAALEVFAGSTAIHRGPASCPVPSGPAIRADGWARSNWPDGELHTHVCPGCKLLSECYFDHAADRACRELLTESVLLCQFCWSGWPLARDRLLRLGERQRRLAGGAPSGVKEADPSAVATGVVGAANNVAGEVYVRGSGAQVRRGFGCRGGRHA